MAVAIKMPQLSDTMDHGTILTWHKKEGDKVSRGDVLAEVATDKADLEIESFDEGQLLRISAPEGTNVSVGSVIAYVGNPGESVPEAESTNGTPQQSSAPPQAAPTVESEEPSEVSASGVSASGVSASGETAPGETSKPPLAGQPSQQVQPSLSEQTEQRVKISPLAKNLAKQHGIDYARVQGSGDGGRIVRRDIEQAMGGKAGATEMEPQRPMPAEPKAPAPAAGNVPFTKMRATIAQRMVQSTSTIPHFYTTTRVNVDSLTDLRTSLKALPQYEGVTYNHLLIRALGLTLPSFPRINSAYSEQGIVQPPSVNVGIVTALEDGLLIPVLKDADSMPLADVVHEARGLVQRARAGRPKGSDLQGGTFTISNMGPYDVEHFTAIINPGQGAILAVSPIQQEAVVKDGKLAIGHMMRLTLSVDHRIIDGVMCGEFLTKLKRVLEEPVLLLA